MDTEDDTNPGAVHPALLQYKVTNLESQVSALSEKIERIEKHHEDEERRKLKVGITALGTAVIALGGTIWAMLPPSAQDAWELLRNGGAR